jgi:hypothetical protein
MGRMALAAVALALLAAGCDDSHLPRLVLIAYAV